MPDRATYLSRLLISRLKDQESARAGEAQDSLLADHRRQLVVKVLAVEVGVTDEASVQRVAGALPRVSPTRLTPDRDIAELADFLRANLDLTLR